MKLVVCLLLAAILGHDPAAPAVPPPVPVVGARVTASGQLALFTAASPVAVNGVNTPAPVTGVDADPTVYRGGKVVALGEAVFFPQARRIPWAAWPLLCGGVRAVAIEDGGEGLDAPPVITVDDSQAGGSGLKLGEPVLASGVTGYAITAAGAGYARPPAVKLTGPTGSGALAYAVVYRRCLVSVVVTAPGSGYGPGTAVSFDPAGAPGSGAAGTVLVDGGRVTGVRLTAVGTGYANGPNVTVADPPTVRPPVGDTAAQAISVVFGADAASWGGTPGTLRAIIPLAGGLPGCGSGYTGPPAVTIARPPAGGMPATATARVSRYIRSVPVLAPGDYLRPPAIKVAGGTRPASLRPLMTGVAPADVITYDAPAGWLRAAGVAPPAAVKAGAVVNSAGRPEPKTGGLPGFDDAPTMAVGVNFGSIPNAPYLAYDAAKNKLRLRPFLPVGAGKVTYGPDGLPASWTSRYISAIVHDPRQGNGLDAMAGPARYGAWTVVYDDPGYGTAAAADVSIRSSTGQAVVTPRPAEAKGTTVTQVFDVRPAVNAASLSPALVLRVGHPAKQWTVSDPWVVAPDPRAGDPAPAVDRSRPLALDDAVLAGLAPRPRAVRWMDATGTYAGQTSICRASDLLDGSRLAWEGRPRVKVPFVAARALNCNPANPAYPWAATRVYGTQSWALQGPDAFGRYLPIPPDDGGRFLVRGNNYFICELRSAGPHGLDAGRPVRWSGTARVPLTDAPDFAPGNSQALVAATVTGPDTVLYFAACGGGGNTPAGVPQTIRGGVEYAIDWAATAEMGPAGGSVPYEFAASACAELGSDYWLNIPLSADDDCIREVMRRVIPRVRGSAIRVLVEYSNECWNFPYNKQYITPIGRLLGALPPRTPMLGGTPEMVVRENYTAMVELFSGHAQDMAESEWRAAGLDPARLVRVCGGWLSASQWARERLAVAQQAGRPVGMVCVAHYPAAGGDTPVVRAFSPAGSPVGGAGSLGVAAMSDVFRWRIALDQQTWPWWSAEAANVAAWGQPWETARVTVSAGAGALPRGGYLFAYTFADARGRETTLGRSAFPFTTWLAAGQVPSLTMPTWPAWAESLVVYAKPYGVGAPWSRYMTIRGARYAKDYPPGSAVPLDVALSPGAGPPPDVNRAADAAGPPPALVGYEGSTQAPVPNAVPLQPDLIHDTQAHPSAADLTRAFLVACQRGNPQVPGSGQSLICYFSAYGIAQYPNVWRLSAGVGQLPGDGSKNQYSTIQGGPPADLHDHNQTNLAVPLGAALGWAAGR